MYHLCNLVTTVLDLQPYLEVDGYCRDVEPSAIIRKASLVNCARMCANDSACASFVYAFKVETCMVMPRFCVDNETQTSETSKIFYKIPGVYSMQLYLVMNTVI